MNNAKASLNRTHLLLAVQSLVVVLVSINRLGPFSLGYVAPNEFLRRVDFNRSWIFSLLP